MITASPAHNILGSGSLNIWEPGISKYFGDPHQILGSYYGPTHKYTVLEIYSFDRTDSEHQLQHLLVRNMWVVAVANILNIAHTLHLFHVRMVWHDKLICKNQIANVGGKVLLSYACYIKGYRVISA
jgi:hypothetical protein